MLVNEGLPLYVVSQIERDFDLSELTVGILGMAFKAESDDIRSSLSYKLKRILRFKAKRLLHTAMEHWSSSRVTATHGSLNFNQFVRRAPRGSIQRHRPACAPAAPSGNFKAAEVKDRAPVAQREATALRWRGSRREAGRALLAPTRQVGPPPVLLAQPGTSRSPRQNHRATNALRVTSQIL
jgi:hypothetical protein